MKSKLSMLQMYFVSGKYRKSILKVYWNCTRVGTFFRGQRAIFLTSFSSECLWSGLSISTFQLLFTVLMLLGRNMDFRTLFLEEMISLHPLKNNFLSLTIKFSPVNCLTRSSNGISLYRCFLSACNFHWLILMIDLELSLKGLVYVSLQNFLLWATSIQKMAWYRPTPSCLYLRMNGLWKLTADQLHSVHTVTEILL